MRSLVLQFFQHIQSRLDAVGTQVQSEREQVEAIIAKKQQGQAQVEQALRELTQANNEVDAIDHELDKLRLLDRLRHPSLQSMECE